MEKREEREKEKDGSFTVCELVGRKRGEEIGRSRRGENIKLSGESAADAADAAEEAVAATAAAVC